MPLICLPNRQLAGGGGEGGFDPTSIANCVLWLQSEQIANGGLLDEDPITTWIDSSGYGHNATQASSGAKPIVKESQINGHRVARFDGSDDYLAVADCGIRDDFSWFCVFKPNYVGEYDCLLGYPGPMGGGMYFRQPYSNQTAHYIPTSTFFSYWIGDDGSQKPYLTGSFYCMSTVNNDGGTMSAWQNGLYDYSAAQSNTSLTGGLVLCNDPVNAGRVLNADVAELIVYDVALGTTDRQIVESYLMSKFALS